MANPQNYRFPKKFWLFGLAWAGIFAGILLILALITGLGIDKNWGEEDLLPPLIVAAASDLQFAFTEIGELYTRQTGQQVIFNFGSTGQLAQQIAHGAPVDVFAAANRQSVLALEQKGYVDRDSITSYAQGSIVLAGKADSFRLKDLGELTSPRVGKIAIANPQHAPYGQAALEALERAGLWDKIKKKVVFTNSVKEVLVQVETGNVDAGILSLSITKGRGVKYFHIDNRLYRPIIQSMAVITGSKNKKGARQFIDLVQGPEGKVILEKYGFQIPEGQ